MEMDLDHLITNQSKARSASDILTHMAGDDILTDNEIQFMRRILNYAIQEYDKLIRSDGEASQAPSPES